MPPPTPRNLLEATGTELEVTVWNPRGDIHLPTCALSCRMTRGSAGAGGDGAADWRDQSLTPNALYVLSFHPPLPLPLFCSGILTQSTHLLILSPNVPFVLIRQQGAPLGPNPPYRLSPGSAPLLSKLSLDPIPLSPYNAPPLSGLSQTPSPLYH